MAAVACEVPLRADAAAAAKPKAEAEAGANGGARCARCKGYATARRSSDPMRRPQTTTTSASRGSQSTTPPRVLSLAFTQLLALAQRVCRGTGYLTRRSPRAAGHEGKGRKWPLRCTYKKKNGSVDLGYHTRCHTRYALGSHTHQHKETPPHSNGAKAHARQVR